MCGCIRPLYERFAQSIKAMKLLVGVQAGDEEAKKAAFVPVQSGVSATLRTVQYFDVMHCDDSSVFARRAQFQPELESSREGGFDAALASKEGTLSVERTKATQQAVSQSSLAGVSAHYSWIIG